MTTFNFWAYLIHLALSISGIYLPKKEYSENVKFVTLTIHLILLIVLVKYK